MGTKANKFTSIKIDLDEARYNKTTTKLLMYIALTNCYGCPKSEDDIELFINNFSGIIGNKGGTSWIAEDVFDEFWMLVYEDAISKFRNAEINYGKFFFKQLKEDMQSNNRKIRIYSRVDEKSDSKIPGEIREYIKNFELSAKYKTEYETYIKEIEAKQREIYNRVNQTCESNKNKVDLPLYLEIVLIHREDIPCGLKFCTADKRIYPFSLTIKDFMVKYRLDEKDLELIYCKVNDNWEPINKLLSII